MTDFDVLARLRRLEAETDKLRDRLGCLERTSRKYRDTPEYRREHQITEHEAYGAMVYAMGRREGNENG